MPWLSLGEEVATNDGFRFEFVSVAALVFIPVILVLALTFAFAIHSAVPLLVALLIPLCFLKTTWIFRYHGPTVERRITLFGRSLLLGTHPLQHGDAASVEPVEDSVLLTVRPRWYRLTLWSTALCKDRVVMKSNRLEDLERTASLFNAAIQKVLLRASS
jgi:hypothetical protein